MAALSDIVLTSDEQVVAHLVGVDARTLADVLVAVSSLEDRELAGAVEAVLFGLVGSVTWRIASAGGVGPLGLEERDALEPIGRIECSAIGEVFVNQGLRPVAYLPDVSAMMNQALGVAGQAVGIEQVRRSM